MSRGTATLVATAALAAVATAAVLLGLPAALPAAPASAATVELRVESSTVSAPLFAGPVSTLPHPVDGGDGSGPHSCDGPPGRSPTPTATGALDDAMRAAGISWRGNWDRNFGDFFIDRIGPYASASPDRYWSLSVNGRFSAGGCQTPVGDGDSVRFFYGPLFGEAPAENGPPPPPGPGPGAGAGRRDENGSHSPGAGPSAKRLRRVAAAAGRYLRRARGGGQGWADLALAVRSGRGREGAAAALLGERLAAQRRDGSIEGDVNATAVAVLALRKRRPRAAARAAAWLARAQAAGGGFGYRPGVPPDVDTTGLATWALALCGRTAAARRGGLFVSAAQATDGGFPAIAGGSSNSQSSGLATVALRVAGLGPRTSRRIGGPGPLGYLVSLARRDGSIAYARGSSPAPVWSTAQALLGLTTRAKLLSNTLPSHDFDGGNDFD